MQLRSASPPRRSGSSPAASVGFFGPGLGATPTAVTKEHGASPRVPPVVQLVGAFFVDIANVVTIQAFVTWLAR
jgi:ESS family glutamate:Na+ symporter